MERTTLDIDELARRIKAAPSSNRLHVEHHGITHEVHLGSISGPVIFGPASIEEVAAYAAGFTAGVVATKADRYPTTATV
jgi:hypothetical protein